MSGSSRSVSSISTKVIKKSDLQMGEVICGKCNGRRRIATDKPKWWVIRFKEVEDLCPKCFGDGKLDWIENVIGKKKPYYGGSSSGSSVSSSSLSSSWTV